MNLVERAKNIMLKPADCWAAIEQEPYDLKTLYVPYMVVLAAIPAVAGFIGMSIMTLAMVFVWGWLVSLLATNFGGQQNLGNAIKLTVYASTPAMVAGIFHLLPGLSVLALLGALYSLYLIYLGLPVLMKNPKEKTIAYMVVATLVGIVCSVLIGVVSSVLMPSPMGRMSGMSGMSGAPGAADFKINTPKGEVHITGGPGAGGNPGDAAMTIKTPDGEVKIDVKSMEQFAKQMEALAEKSKEAQK